MMLSFFYSLSALGEEDGLKKRESSFEHPMNRCRAVYITDL